MFGVNGVVFPYTREEKVDISHNIKVEHENSCSEIEEDQDVLPYDIAIYSGGMDGKSTENFLEWCCQEKKEATNLLLFLSTTGGQASVAYRLSRALQKKYENVYIVIPWICKSAGTLLCIGANALIFGDHGELGPLDVQIPQKDELIGYSSGLTPLHALSILREESFACFEKTFISIIEKSSGQISTNRAAKIAIDLTVGLFSEIYAQIDPMQLGQTTRDMAIAKVYGERLNAVSQNLHRGALNRLLNGYPEHGFVIDSREAEGLFVRVFPMDDSLKEIVEQYLHDIKNAIFAQRVFFCIVSEHDASKESTPVDGEGEKAIEEHGGPEPVSAKENENEKHPDEPTPATQKARDSKSKK